MTSPMLSTCPVCSSRMEVRSLHCQACNTTMNGRFSPCRFCGLSQEQRQFVEVFLASRGNIKEVERILGISYPTVRNRLDAVIETMGYRVERQEDDRRRSILDALNRGEVSSEEAVKMLRSK